MKRVLKVFSLLFVCLLLSSCVKYNATITVNSDKSMDFSFISAIKKEYASQMSNTEDFNKYKDEGFVVESYITDDYEGYKVSKHYVSIDEVSSEDIDTSKLTDNDDKLFNIKKGFFKNTYTAKLVSNDTNDMMDKSQMYEDDEDVQELIKQFDFKFNLNLPNPVKSSNATSISADQKHLEWNLANMKDPYIEFTFELYNWNNIWLTAGIGLIILCIAAFVIKHLLGTKHRLYMLKENIKNKKSK